MNEIVMKAFQEELQKLAAINPAQEASWFSRVIRGPVKASWEKHLAQIRLAKEFKAAVRKGFSGSIDDFTTYKSQHLKMPNDEQIAYDFATKQNQQNSWLHQNKGKLILGGAAGLGALYLLNKTPEPQAQIPSNYQAV